PRPLPTTPLAVRLFDVPKSQEKRETPILGGTPRQTSAPAVAPQPRRVAPAPRPAPSQAQAPVRNPVQPTPTPRESQPLPTIQTPDIPNRRSSAAPSNPEPLKQADPENALKHLDRYISPGAGGTAGSPGGGAPGGTGGSG